MKVWKRAVGVLHSLNNLECWVQKSRLLNEANQSLATQKAKASPPASFSYFIQFVVCIDNNTQVESIKGYCTVIKFAYGIDQWHEVVSEPNPRKIKKGVSGKSAGVEVYTAPGMKAHF